MPSNGHKPIKHLRDLLPDKANARKHGSRNVGLIETALGEVGAGRSIVIDENGAVLAGNATIEAAARAGIERVQVVKSDGRSIVAVQRDGLTAKQKKRLALLDNAPNAPEANPEYWDDVVIADIAKRERELLDGIFRDNELNKLLAGQGGDADAEPQIDRAEELNKKWKVAAGDLFAIGSHRLLCGDSTRREDVERVMGGEKAGMMFADPPFEKDYESRGSKGAVEKSDTWEMICNTVSEFCESTPTWYVKAGWRDAIDLCPLVHPQDFIVWAKRGFGLGNGDYRPQHEILLYKNSGKPCRAGADVGNVWEFPVPFRGRMLHVAETPVGIIERAVGFSSDVLDLVFDPFAGSGTTLVACQNLSRRCRAIEISQNYVAVCLERMATAFPDLVIERVKNGKARK